MPAPTPIPRPITPDVWFGPYADPSIGQKGAKASVFLDATHDTTWSAAIIGGSSWLALDPPTSGTGSALLTVIAQTSTGPQRSAQLKVTAPGGRTLLECRVIQASAEALAVLNDSVMEVPFPNVPRVMELAIAGNFIGTELQKLPIVIVRPIVVLIVEVIVAVAGLLLVLLRELVTQLDPQLPEPVTWFPAPPAPPGFPPFGELAKVLPVTTVIITEETYLLALFIAQKAFE